MAVAGAPLAIAALVAAPVPFVCSTAATRELRHDAINSVCSSTGSSLNTSASTPAGQTIFVRASHVAVLLLLVTTAVVVGEGNGKVVVLGALMAMESSMGEGSGEDAVELAFELKRLAVRVVTKRRLPSIRCSNVFGGWTVRKRGAGADVEVEGVVLMGKSFSLSRELRRRSQTRSLLGEATSAAESPTSAAKRLRLETSNRPMRLFFGEGSTSVSEKSLKSELVAADSEPLSSSMGTGDAVVALLL